MKDIKLTIHDTGKVDCSLSGKSDQDGLVVTFDDGTATNAGLSWKGLKQLVTMKMKQGQAKKPAPASSNDKVTAK